MGLQQLHLGPAPDSDVMPLRRKAKEKGRSPVDHDWAPKKPSVRLPHRLAQQRGPVFFQSRPSPYAGARAGPSIPVSPGRIAQEVTDGTHAHEGSGVGMHR